MKKSLRIPVFTASLLLLTTGSALAMFLNVNPTPVSEPGTMLIFGTCMTVISISGQQNYRENRNQQKTEDLDD
jgi:hypothetical protein